MAANLTQLGESVQHLSKAYKSVIDLGEALREIGSLEQRAKDAERAAAVAVARNDEAQAALQSTLNGLATARDEVQKAADAIKAMERKAREGIDAQVKAAEADISTKRAAAEAEIEDQKRQMALQKRTHEAWLVKAAEERDAAAAELNRINTMIAEIKAKLG